jgi:hypothetical protein
LQHWDSFESKGRRKTEVLNVIANVLALTEEERVSLGLLSAWEVQLKHMMGGTAAAADSCSKGGSPKTARAQPFAVGRGVSPASDRISPQKSEHGPTLGGAAPKTQPEQGGGGFGDLWTMFLRTDV